MSSLVRKNIAYLTVVQAANYIIPFITIPYITRVVGLENFGLIEYASSLVSYFVLMINFGFDTTATRKIARLKGDFERISVVFSHIYLLKSALFVISLLIFGVLLIAVPTLREEAALLSFAFLINFGFLLFPLWLFQGLQQLKQVALWTFLSKTLVAILVFILIQEKADYLYYPLLGSLGQILIGVIALLYIRTKMSIKWQRPRTALLILYLKEGFGLFKINLVVNLYSTTNIILVKFLMSPAQAGLYAGAHKLIFVANTLILGPFTQAFFPHIASLFRSNKVLFRASLNKALKFLTMVTFLLAVVCWIFADSIVTIVYGESFIGAAMLLRILSLHPLLAAFTNIFGYQGLINLKKEELYFRITLVMSLLSLGLNFLLIPVYGATATAVIRVFIEILVASSAFYFFRKNVAQA